MFTTDSRKDHAGWVNTEMVTFREFTATIRAGQQQNNATDNGTMSPDSLWGMSGVSDERLASWLSTRIAIGLLIVTTLLLMRFTNQGTYLRIPAFIGAPVAGEKLWQRNLVPFLRKIITNIRLRKGMFGGSLPYMQIIEQNSCRE